MKRWKLAQWAFACDPNALLDTLVTKCVVAWQRSRLRELIQTYRALELLVEVVEEVGLRSLLLFRMLPLTSGLEMQC